MNDIHRWIWNNHLQECQKIMMEKCFIYILLYFCHLQQGYGDIMCIESQGHLLYFSQLQNKYLESVLFHFWGPDESEVYIQYQRLQYQFDNRFHIIRKLKVTNLKMWQ